MSIETENDLDMMLADWGVAFQAATAWTPGASQFIGLLEKGHNPQLQVGATRPALTLKSSDAATHNLGDGSQLITADGEQFTIKGPLRPDGTGLTEADLYAG